MELERLQQHWNAFGEQDPLWAILAFPDKRGGAWDLEEFFATGRADVDDVLRLLADRGIAIERGRALDFGCGVGRLTRALAEHFDSCDGVDLAGSMIERARELNTNGDRVRFHHNAVPDLRLFGDGSFDFILSRLVLQHMEPELMRGYMREFVRVLRPGGVAVFNVPESFVVAEPLPPEAWRASLTLIGTIPPLAPGRVAPLRVKVRNDSSVPWPASAQVQVGDHWRTRDGRLVLFDDARTVIESAVDPGGECEVQLDVVCTAPARRLRAGDRSGPRRDQLVRRPRLRHAEATGDGRRRSSSGRLTERSCTGRRTDAVRACRLGSRRRWRCIRNGA